MAVPGGISSLSTVAASNGPDGATELPSVLDNYQRTHFALFKRALSKDAATLSATLTLAVTDDYGRYEVAGSGEIIAIDDTFGWPGREVGFRFNAATTLSHSTNFALLGQGQIVTVAGDHTRFVRRTSGTWEMVSYERASGIFTAGTLTVKGSASFSATLVAKEVIATSFSGTGWQLLQTMSASSVASLDTSSLTGYAAYKLVIQNLVPATNAVNLWLRVASDGGSSFTAAANAYGWTRFNVNSSGASGGAGSFSDSKIVVNDQSIANDPNHGVNGEIVAIELAGPKNHYFLTDTSHYDGSTVQRVIGHGNTGTQTLVNALRLMFSSGNISTGGVKVYGMR